MHFFWYASTIGWLTETVVIFLVSATADTILLFCSISTAQSRCIREIHTILGFLPSADPSRFWLLFHIGQTRPIDP
jgi:4-amino-4-deoxy-L-arabinose transferase-like glycosyltransferase